MAHCRKSFPPSSFPTTPSCTLPSPPDSRCESACKWLMAPEQVEMLIVPDLAQDIR